MNTSKQGKKQGKFGTGVKIVEKDCSFQHKLQVNAHQFE